MRKQDPNPSNKSIKKALFFFFFVIFLIVISLTIRFVNLISESTFDEKNRYTFAITTTEFSKVITVDPVNRTVATVDVIGKDVFAVGKTLGIFVDGSISPPKSFQLSQNDPKGTIFKILLHPTVKKNNINEIDLLRLYLFINRIPPKDFSYESIKNIKAENDADMIIAELFLDPAIIEENKSIEIINGTEISGMGKRLERLIKHAGGNVVSVTNSQTIERETKIYYHQETSYTLEKLQRILSAPIISRENRTIADITIIIGIDKAKTSVF